MEFQNHYWFTEVTRKPQGVEIYHRFQEGLGAVPLYEELQTEVRELRDHYERKFERQISSLLNFLTFVGLPAGLLVELFSNALIRQATWGEFLLTALLMYAVLGGLWLLWRFFRR
jgi:magnesium-transporting ATPase (P-type)